MGSCGIVRGPGHGARAGALRAAVGVVLLGLGLSLSVPARTACAPAAALQSLTQPQYNDTDGTISSAGFLSPFVKSFLHTVQRNPFPAGQSNLPRQSTVLCPGSSSQSNQMQFKSP